MSGKPRLPVNRRDFLRGASGAVAIVALGVAGCGNGGSQSRSGGAFTSEIAVSHLTGTIDGAPLIIAQELGYLADVGLDLELISFSGGSETVRGIIQAGMPFGVPSTVATATAAARAAPELRFVAGNNNSATVRFLVPHSSPLRSPDELRGKRVAVSRPGSLSTYFAETMVRSVGLEPGRDTELVSVGGAPDAWTATSQGVTDACWSAPPFSTSLVSQGEARELALAGDFVTAWADSLITTTRRFIDEQPQVLQDLVGALDRAMNVMRTDAQRAAEAYAPRIQVDVEVARRTLTDNPEAWSTSIPAAAIPEILTAASALQGVERGVLQADQLVDPRFVSGA